ncbi:ATP-binding protein [Vreelandella aquamarina]|uniref:ATP-binding protein n=1 Tax=Vreelandella aquamarina TaxID=77097 RepID=UPI00384B33E6
MNQATHLPSGELETIQISETQDVLLELVERLFEYSPLRVVVTDRRFRVLYANEASCTATGYSRDELKRMPAHLWRIDPNPRLLVYALLKALRRGQHIVKRLSHCRADGGFWQEERLWLPLITSINGSHELILSIGWNIDEFLAVEARTIRSENMRAMLNLMTGLSHEFNNLLGSINGLAELNQLLLSEEHPAFENSRQIRQAGERAAALISDMAFCADSINLNYHPCNPRTLMLSALQRCQMSAASHFEVRLVFDEVPDSAILDATVVEKALAQVIENALHAMEDTDDPCLSLKVGFGRLLGGEPCLEMSIGDNGVGMDQKMQSRVFHSFFTTKAPGKGRGLGMVMVNACALQHGGDVKITSMPGEGTEVALLLPLKPIPLPVDLGHDEL